MAAAVEKQQTKRKRLRKKRSDVTEGDDSSSAGDDVEGTGEGTSEAAALFGNAIGRIIKAKDDGTTSHFLAEYSLKEKQAEERAKRRAERKLAKKKRAFEIDGGAGNVSESSESEQSEEEAVKRRRLADRQLLRRHLLNQAHGRDHPILAQPDYEKRLRRWATKGVVRLFNTVALAQRGDPEEVADRGSKGDDEKKEVSKSKFLEMLKKGVESKRVKEMEDEAASPPKKKFRPGKPKKGKKG